MNTKHSGYAVAYAAALGLVCALALTAVDGLTAARKRANEEAEEVRTILAVLDVPVERGAAAGDLVAAYDATVTTEERDGLTLYVYDRPEGRRLSAIRFQGPGLWGPIEGLLCLEDDMRTIHAISFYRQEETPGLGGEIASPDFEGRFRGKSIVSGAGVPGVRLVMGGATGPNEVDAISGATMTSEKVQAILDAVSVRILEEGRPSGE